MVAELTALRDQIDEVDKALLDLLARRMALVAEVGEVKSKYGLPIYVPEREASMLASRRKEAQALGVSPDLIEDVLRRVMRESYSSENDKGFKTLCPSLRPVVIVGGAGQMGRLFEKMLTMLHHYVTATTSSARPGRHTKEEISYVITCAIGSTIGVLHKWTRDNFDLAPEVIAGILTQIFLSGMLPLLS